MSLEAVRHDDVTFWVAMEEIFSELHHGYAKLPRKVYVHGSNALSLP